MVRKSVRPWLSFVTVIFVHSKISFALIVHRTDIEPFQAYHFVPRYLIIIGIFSASHCTNPVPPEHPPNGNDNQNILTCLGITT